MLATAFKLTFAKHISFMQIKVQTQYKLKNNIIPGQFNLPCTPGHVFMDAKLFIRTPKYETKFSSKINLCWVYEKHGYDGNQNAIQEWGCAYKITHISAVMYHILLKLVPN